MYRIGRQLLPAVALLLGSGALLAQQPARYELQLGVDLSFVNVDGYTSWTEYGPGKLRYDEDSDGLMMTRAFIDYSLRVTDTLNLQLAGEIYDDFGPLAGLTEAFVEWRPLVQSSNRYRFKVGEFYSHLSLENTGPGWGSPYSLTPSVINTWLGEEIRLQGAELSFSRRPASLGGAHTFALNAAAFYANDPAGTLLSWKGWSAHDRQSRFNDELPLPPVPQIEPGGWFNAQDPYTEPFLEIDDTPGYYLSGEWTIANRLLLRLSHYDNRADPEAADNGQFGWRTDFDHIGLQLSLPGDVGLLVQWIEGETEWGRETNGVRAVEAYYESYYALLTRNFGNHRISARYDFFEVTDEDNTPMDSNAEEGNAWMLAYRYSVTPHLTLAAEWLQIETERDAFEYFGLPRSVTERQLQLTAQLRFSSPN